MILILILIEISNIIIGVGCGGGGGVCLIGSGGCCIILIIGGPSMLSTIGLQLKYVECNAKQWLIMPINNMPYCILLAMLLEANTFHKYKYL